VKRSALFRIVLPVAVVLVALVISVAMIKMRPKPAHQRPERPAPLVTAQIVKPAVDPVVITGYGTVVAKQRIEIIPQVNGRVEAKSLRFEAGEFVSAGDTLLVIEQTDYLQARALARANLAAARTTLAMAEQEGRIARGEWERLHAGEQASPLVLHEPQIAQARASVDAASAALDLAETNLSRCYLTAPFDGRVEASMADLGQYLRAGTTVGAFYSTDIAEVTVPVSAEDMEWIRVADGRKADAPVTVRADLAGHTSTWPGQAVRLGGTVDPATRQVPVVVEIPDPFRAGVDRPALLTGMFVTVDFRKDPPPAAVTILRDALRTDDTVWVITPERTLTIRPVQVAHAGTRNTLITAGLEPGEMICTSNLQVVTEGMPVRVKGEGEKPAAANGDTIDSGKGAGR